MKSSLLSRFLAIRFLAQSAVLAGTLALPVFLTAQAPAAQPAARIFPIRGGYLGVGIQEITPERAKALKLREEAGVEITSVIHESPAETAGLKAGDVVISYNGQKVEGREQFSRMVRETPAGHEAKLEIVRNGFTQTVTVKIDNRTLPRVLAPDGVHLNMPDMPMPDIPRVFQGMHSPILGVEAESIDGQLAAYFGTKDPAVLVRTVLKNSAAEKAGLKAGDVILRVDDIKVASAADISARLRAAQGKSVQLALLRDHKEMTLSVVPESSEHLTQPQR
jgi:serine protease Do